MFERLRFSLHGDMDTVGQHRKAEPFAPVVNICGSQVCFGYWSNGCGHWNRWWCFQPAGHGAAYRQHKDMLIRLKNAVWEVKMSKPVAKADTKGRILSRGKQQAANKTQLCLKKTSKQISNELTSSGTEKTTIIRTFRPVGEGKADKHFHKEGIVVEPKTCQVDVKARGRASGRNTEKTIPAFRVRGKEYPTSSLDDSDCHAIKGMLCARQ
eukprot:scaffold27101_cov31-Prasinocladus_malaysianus.AAC.1